MISWEASQEWNCAENKKHPVSSSSAGKNAFLLREVVEKSQTGQSWQEDSNANNHTLQQWYAEEHVWTHKTSNLLSG